MARGRPIVAIDEAEAVKRLDAAAVAFPRELDKALGRAASILKRQVRAAVSGRSAIAPLRPLDTVTILLHGNLPLGGVLSDMAHIRVSRTGRYTRSVGPAEYMERLFSLWQDGGTTRVGDKGVRHALYRALGRLGQAGLVKSMPLAYEGRPVIPKITENAKPLFRTWILGALDNALKRRR